MKKRIWELDVLRGVFIIAMVIVHLLYDLELFFAIGVCKNPLFSFVANWGGVLFFLLSGICATLGAHPVRRGLVVFGCGLVVSAVTVGMYFLNMADAGFIIYFGVLHCLGVCMLLWPLVRRLPWQAMAPLALCLIAVGLFLDGRTFPTGLYLMPFGFQPTGFASSDYFPLLPFFGFFLAGGVIGKTLYRRQQTLFPRVCPENPAVRVFSLVGRWSLPVYILHQPVITGILTLLEVLL